jgi:GNAT superfamily N-acetyltransferase
MIRTAVAADAGEISALLQAFSHTFTASPDGAGAEAFFESLRPAAIAALIARPDVHYLVLRTAQGGLAGAAGMQGGVRLIHLFVDTPWQRQGWGRRLWELLRVQALAHGQPGCFQVNASLAAVPAYLRLGFVPSGPQVQRNGGRWLPMEQPV